VGELLYVSKQIWSDAVNVREMMVFLLLAYLVLVFILVAALRWTERAIRVPGVGQAGAH
jgi:polar amino acid transport system permease protein